MNDIQQAPKNNSRLIILVTILTSLSILTSGWLYYQNLQLQKQISQLSIKPSPSPTSTPAQSIEPIANWKTYTNNVFNYSLKVPNDYFVGLRGNINNINIEDLNNIEIFSSSQKMYYDNNIMYLGWSIKKWKIIKRLC